MAIFRINYSRVVQQANQMNCLADDLQTEISRLERKLNTSREEWKGPAADEYRKQLSNLITKMRRTKVKMYNVSRSIKTNANRIQREDIELAERIERESKELMNRNNPE